MTGPDHASTLGELVARDYRAAAVFEQFDIDFCCGGRRSFMEGCADAGADPDAVARALDARLSADSPAEDVHEWPVPRLIDRIVLTHHAFVRSEAPTLARQCAKIAAVHGKRHPELQDVTQTFDDLVAELLEHLEKEELILFPYVRGLASNVPVASPCFGTVANPVRMMEIEHGEAGERLKTLRTLTHDYAVPDDACATYRVAMQRLDAFERDLHRHIHLENNLLFPRAIDLESERRSWGG